MKRIVKRVLKRIIKIVIFLLLLSFIGLLVLTSWNFIERAKTNKQVKELGEDVTVDGKRIHVYQTGEGDHTIVLLSGLGTYSPIVDFMPLAERLGQNNKVVIIEYLGYGLSDDTNKERTSEYIVEEIRETLNVMNIKPPYILMPHSISGIYSQQYAKEYPKEVEGIIGIDMSMPEQFQFEKENLISPNMHYLAAFFNISGLSRFEMNQMTDYYFDMMAGNYYSPQQILLSKEIGSRNEGSQALINENNNMLNNAEILYDVKFSEGMPVLMFLSSDSIEQYNKLMEESGHDVTWEGLHKDAITNASIQKIIKLHGKHYLHWTQADSIVEDTENFIDSIYNN